MAQLPRPRERNDDDSIDELAGESLLKDVPQHLMRTESLHSELVSNDPRRPTSSNSMKSITNDLDKPLPSLPSTEENSRQVPTRSALAPKTTNLKVRKNENPRLSKSIISPPILQSTTSSALHAETSPATSHSAMTAMTLPVMLSNDVDHKTLNRKISDLMQQAAAQEAESNRKEAILNTQLAKPSPRQRAKRALTKATRAIKDRLSSGSSSDKRPRCRLSSASPPESVFANEHDLQPLEREQSNALTRRMAEGMNLSNPKIQSLTGDGACPRKPLPVYESMRSRSQRPDPDDPFSDDDPIRYRLTPNECSAFDFEFSKQKQRSKSKTAESSACAIDQVDGPPAEQYADLYCSKSRFTNLVSGLAQHPDVMYFSSSPDATSTPDGKLNPRFGLTQEKRGGSVKSPSILEFSFEEHSDNDDFVAVSPASKAVTDGSQSVKRKSAQDDLRSRIQPAAKKTKTSTQTAEDDIATRLSHLETEDEYASLSPSKKKTTKKAQLSGKRTGLKIFDLKKGKGKGKMAETKHTESAAKQPHQQGSTNKRSSLARPNSMLFGRESRLGNKKFSKLDEDEMDVDELA